MARSRLHRSIWLALVLAIAAIAHGSEPADSKTVRCRNGAVVCVNEPAAAVGLQALKNGGSAVDAAVATAFALAVTHPAAGNIGGGGYMLVLPAGGDPVVFDFREVAPVAATHDMFADPADRTPHRRVGVPGTVRGLALAHRRFGRRKWNELVAPAVALARDGFELDAATARSLNDVLADSDEKQFAALHATFGQKNGRPWKAGDRLVQPELADTLAEIAEQGPDAFYQGKIADRLAAEMIRGGGLITKDDLQGYQAIQRTPLRGTYRGFEILAVPPSSSGGTTLIEALNILENFELDRNRWSSSNVHLMVEAMRRAYRDRARYLGDPDATSIPAHLLAKERAKELAAGIDPRRATPSTDLAGDIPLTVEAEHTTHLSVIDADRTAVSMTYTLENSYGSRVMVPDAGFLLNDEMNDFNWLPGVTDATGRIGTDANLVRPGRRMLSSMCPTIIAKQGKPVLITGSPGGRTIINTVLCVVSGALDFKLDARAAVDAPRIHHGWFPDIVRVEPGLVTQNPAIESDLKALGHQLAKPGRQGDAHTIAIDGETGEITAAADTRIHGAAAGF
jgi:gamma-glutamyltranspeptidase/glutathione hydrolase